MAGVSVLFVYLFLREALPGAPWAWTVGALGVALYPLLGFMSGAVNPDAMLCAVSAALFCCLARAFRRGLTPRLGVAIGVVTAVGFLTKLNFVGLAPGIALALVVLTRRAARSDRGAALRSLGLAAVIGAGPVLIYTLVNVISNHAGLGVASSGIHITSRHGSVLDELVYVWQLYLPRLPGMATDFPGIFPPRQLWFDRTVGLYGWLDTFFPDWVYTVALIPAALIAALCARTLVLRRAALRRRLPELAVYALIAVGVLGLVGADSYLEFPARSGAYSEPRYLLPLAAIFGAVLALAARGAGRRWGPVAGTLIVLLILGHNIFSQLLTVARYYG
jgi:4-amino-4-deoxy-L-arabinose transferase-like glycosyltransferase